MVCTFFYDKHTCYKWCTLRNICAHFDIVMHTCSILLSIQYTWWILVVFYVQKCAHQKCARSVHHFVHTTAQSAESVHLRKRCLKQIYVGAHRAHCAHFLYFLCTLAMSTLCTPCTPQAHCAQEIVKESLCFSFSRTLLVQKRRPQVASCASKERRPAKTQDSR